MNAEVVPLLMRVEVYSQDRSWNHEITWP